MAPEVMLSWKDRILTAILLATVFSLTAFALADGWFNYNAAVGGAIGAALGLWITRRQTTESS